MTGIPVTQTWTHELSFMQQSVLITAIRGPDAQHRLVQDRFKYVEEDNAKG